MAAYNEDGNLLGRALALLVIVGVGFMMSRVCALSSQCPLPSDKAAKSGCCLSESSK